MPPCGLFSIWQPTDNHFFVIEKAGLKLNIQKTKIMASDPITSRQLDGITVMDFIFLGSKVTADGDCRHKIKRRLPLWRKAMTNLDAH